MGAKYDEKLSVFDFFQRRHKKDFFEAGSWFKKLILSINKQKIQSNTKNHLAVVWTDGDATV